MSCIVQFIFIVFSSELFLAISVVLSVSLKSQHSSLKESEVNEDSSLKSNRFSKLSSDFALILLLLFLFFYLYFFFSDFF